MNEPIRFPKKVAMGERSSEKMFPKKVPMEERSSEKMFPAERVILILFVSICFQFSGTLSIMENPRSLSFRVVAIMLLKTLPHTSIQERTR